MTYHYDPRKKEIPDSANIVMVHSTNLETGKTEVESFIRINNNLFIDERGLLWTHGIIGFYYLRIQDAIKML